MNERIITTESMKADHQTWLAAHAQWRQDIDRWQAEHKSAVARLPTPLRSPSSSIRIILTAASSIRRRYQNSSIDTRMCDSW
jgi:hypothetical protein